MKGGILEVLSIPCDLTWTTAVKAREEFEKSAQRKATILRVSSIDDILAHEIVKAGDELVGLSVQVDPTFKSDTWAVGDEDTLGVGSVGA